MRRKGLIWLTLALLLGVASWFLLTPGRPPNEKTLISNFKTHRTDFEKLRAMLLEDPQIRRIGETGIESEKLIGPRAPSEVGVSQERFKQYLELLERAGAKSVFRSRDKGHDDIGVGIWATGFGGDTRHLDLYWMEREPADQIANLDDYYRNSQRRPGVFRHVEGNWYLRAD